ncbi:copper-translocating P-type ATPase [Bacillaceae bacterium SIJ1]|uniref:heavy metal translocating P-type ATPase n=1 Tax=Litoribacterium kuwaitense TaxID=1398745 RepID=UPI0013EDC611|nr:heavy metal translocating P-type ATPase [Litoribacterium kuwaitense]NGP45271.1 copper-translocating P-type ATPase [Litoribacterium kuwaitense]
MSDEKQTGHDHHHNDHHSQSGGHHGGHDHSHMVSDFKQRFYISVAVTIPILLLSPMIQQFLNIDLAFPFDQYVLFALATFVFFYGGWPFLKGIIDEVKDKSPGMMTLIGLAIIVAYGYSSFVVFGWPGKDFFWELATLIDIMLLGHWIEMKSVMGASNALQELVKLMPDTAHRIGEDGKDEEVKISELKAGDHVLVKPGEKMPVDGVILEGQSAIDESMLTGESVPVEKAKNDEVIGGSINKEGSLTIEVKHTGEDTYLSNVITLVQEAQESKSKAQDLANRAAKWLFYIALAAGFLTLFTWLGLGFTFDTSLERMVTVMIIACPHALGLAAPLVTAVSTSLSAKKGLLIRNRTPFESARKLDAVIFDKTGTLTKGEFGVTDIIPVEGEENEAILQYAASVEQHSEHPLATGILNKAKEEELDLEPVEDFSSMTGKGLRGRVAGKDIFVVSPGYVRDEGIAYDEEAFDRMASEGKTVVFVLVQGELAGMIALADMIRDSAKETIATLKERNIDSIMVTGDNKQVAHWVAKQLDMDEVYAEVLPDHKADQVKSIQADGRKVAMTGDGVNDAPALATADLGIAIGSGTDVAVETADIVLVKSNPKDILSIIDLSRNTYRKMVQNLWWAAGYNILAIPLAAGILAPIGIVLSPAVGAVLMSISTVVVAINARMLTAD